MDSEEEVFKPDFLKDPYFIPGYGGYCPRFLWESVGKTYGRATRAIMKKDPFIATRLMPLTQDEERSARQSRKKPRKTEQDGEDQDDEDDRYSRYSKKDKTSTSRKGTPGFFEVIRKEILSDDEPDTPITVTRLLGETRHYFPKGHRYYNEAMKRNEDNKQDTKRTSQKNNENDGPGWLRTGPQFFETYMVHKWFGDEPTSGDKKCIIMNTFYSDDMNNKSMCNRSTYKGRCETKTCKNRKNSASAQEISKYTTDKCESSKNGRGKRVRMRE